MRLHFIKPLDTSWNLLRQAGYQPDRGNRGQVSYSKPLMGSSYPRFHIYIQEEIPGERIVLTLHLDQKKPSYQGSHSHSGEYEGEIVGKEAERLKALFS